MNEKLVIDEQFPIIARSYDYNHFTYPLHFHNEFEIIYIKEGSGERFVADSIEQFKSGDVILIGSNVPHYMKSDKIYYEGISDLRVKGVVIQFAHDFMSNAINNYADLSRIKQLLEDSKRGVYFPYPHNSDIIQCIEELSSHSDIYLIINLLSLLDKMGSFKYKRYLGSPSYSEKGFLIFDDRIEKVYSFLSYHYTEKLRLDEIASMVSMHTSAFCRYFKEKTGKSCIEHIQDLRISRARRLILETSHDISQISIDSGFNTSCHFNKIFKRKTGFTPSVYRKKFTL